MSFDHIIFAGDFNIVPQGAIYHYLVSGFIDLMTPVSQYSNYYFAQKTKRTVEECYHIFNKDFKIYDDGHLPIKEEFFQ